MTKATPRRAKEVSYIMRIVIILTLVAIYCSVAISSPTQINPSTSIVARLIALSVKNEKTNLNKLSTRHINKRLSEPLISAFSRVDGNHNTHVTAEEFVRYYAANFPLIGLTKTQWTNAFQQSLPIGDTNNNAQLEIHEFAQLANLGGYRP